MDKNERWPKFSSNIDDCTGFHCINGRNGDLNFSFPSRRLNQKNDAVMMRGEAGLSGYIMMIHWGLSFHAKKMVHPVRFYGIYV